MSYRFLAPDGSYYDVPDTQFSDAIAQGGVPIEAAPKVDLVAPNNVIQSLPYAEAQPLLSQGYKLLPYAKPLKMLGPDNNLYDIPGSDVSTGIAQGGRVILKDEILGKKQTQAAADAYYPNWIGPKLNLPINQLKNGDLYLDTLAKNAKGPAGFTEGLNLWDASSVPYLGSAVDAVDLGKAAITANRVINNDLASVSDQDLVDLNLYLTQLDRQSNGSFWGKVGNVIKGSAVFGAEIASSLALLPLLGVGAGTGAGVAASKATIASAKKAINHTVQKYVAKKLGAETVEAAEQLVITGGKKGASAMAKTAGALAEISALPVPTMLATSGLQLGATAAVLGEPGTQAYNQRKLFNAISGKDEQHAGTVMRSLGDSYIEYLSEASGLYLIGGLTKSLRLLPGAKTMEGAGKALSETFERWAKEAADGGLKAAASAGTKAAAQTAADAVPGAVTRGITRAKTMAAAGAVLGTIAARKGINLLEASDYLRSAGYNGVLPEMLEERLGGFLRGLLGIHGDEASLRNAFDQMFPSGEQLAVEAVAFATPIALLGGAHLAVNAPHLQQMMEESQLLSKRLAFNLEYHQMTPEEKAKISKETIKLLNDEEADPALRRLLLRTEQYKLDQSGLLKVVNSISDYVAGIKYVPTVGLITNPNVRLAASMQIPMGEMMVKMKEVARGRLGYAEAEDDKARKTIDAKADTEAVNGAQTVMQTMGKYLRLKKIAGPAGDLATEQDRATNKLIEELAELDLVTRDIATGSAIVKSLSRAIDEGFGHDSEQVKLIKQLTADVREGLFLRGIGSDGISAADALAARAYIRDVKADPAIQPSVRAQIGLQERDDAVVAEATDPHSVADSRLMNVLANPDTAPIADVFEVMTQFGFNLNTQDQTRFREWTAGTRQIMSDGLDAMPHERSMYTEVGTRNMYRVTKVNKDAVLAKVQNTDGTEGAEIAIPLPSLQQNFEKHKLTSFRIAPHTMVRGTLDELYQYFDTGNGKYPRETIEKSASRVGRNAKGVAIFSVGVGAQASGDGRTLTISSFAPVGYHSVEDFFEAAMKQLNTSRGSKDADGVPTEVAPILQKVMVAVEKLVAENDYAKKAEQLITKEQQDIADQAIQVKALGQFELLSKLIAHEVKGYSRTDARNLPGAKEVRFAAALLDKGATSWRKDLETFAQNLPMVTEALWTSLSAPKPETAKGAETEQAASEDKAGAPAGIALTEDSSTTKAAPKSTKAATRAAPTPVLTEAKQTKTVVAKPAADGLTEESAADPAATSVGDGLTEEPSTKKPTPKQITFKNIPVDALHAEPTSLAYTKKDGTIVLNNAAIEQDYAAGLPYLRGEVGVYGPQKREVLKALGVSTDELMEFFKAHGGVGAYKAMLRAHEESHVANLAADHAVYATAAAKQGDFKLDPDVLAIEIRATQESLERVGFFRARTTAAEQIAKDLGIEFRGTQKTPGAPDQAVFNDAEPSGAGFNLQMPVTKEQVAARLEEKRKEFNKTPAQAYNIPLESAAAKEALSQPSTDVAPAAPVPTTTPPVVPPTTTPIIKPSATGDFYTDDESTKSLAAAPNDALHKMSLWAQKVRTVSRYGDPDDLQFKRRFSDENIVRSMLGAFTRDPNAIEQVLKIFKESTAAQIAERAKVEIEAASGHSANWSNIGAAVDSAIGRAPQNVIVAAEAAETSVEDSEAGDTPTGDPDRAITPWADTAWLDTQIRRDPVTRFVYGAYHVVTRLPFDMIESRIFQPLFALYYGQTPAYLRSREAFEALKKDSTITAEERALLENDAAARDFQILKDIWSSLSYEDARRAHWNLSNLIAVNAYDILESSTSTYDEDGGRTESTPILELRRLNGEGLFEIAKMNVTQNTFLAKTGKVNAVEFAKFAEEATRVLGNRPEGRELAQSIRDTQPKRWRALTEMIAAYAGLPVSVVDGSIYTDQAEKAQAFKALARMVSRGSTYSRRKFDVPDGVYSIRALVNVWQDLKKANPGKTPEEIAALMPINEVRQWLDDTFLSVPEALQKLDQGNSSNLYPLAASARSGHTTASWHDPINKRHPTSMTRNQLIEDWLHGANTPAERKARLAQIGIISGLSRKSGSFVRGQTVDKLNPRELFAVLRELFTGNAVMPSEITIPVFSGDKLAITTLRIDISGMPQFAEWQTRFAQAKSKTAVFKEVFRAAQLSAADRLGRRSSNPSVFGKRSAQILTPLGIFYTDVEGGLPDKVTVLVFDDKDGKHFDGWAGYLGDTEKMLKISAADYSSKVWHMFKGGIYGKVGDEFVHIKPLFVLLSDQLSDAFGAADKATGLSYAKLQKALRAFGPATFIVSSETAKLLPATLIRTTQVDVGNGEMLSLQQLELETRHLGLTAPTGGDGNMTHARQLSYQVLTSLLSTVGVAYEDARRVMKAFSDAVLLTASKFDPKDISPENLARSQGSENIRALLDAGVGVDHPYLGELLGQEMTAKIRAGLSVKALGPQTPLTHSPHVGDPVELSPAGGLAHTQLESDMLTRKGKFKHLVSAYKITPEGVIYPRVLNSNAVSSQQLPSLQHNLIVKETEGIPAGVRDQYKEIFRRFMLPVRGTSDVIYFADSAWGSNLQQVSDFIQRLRTEYGMLKDMMFVNEDGTYSDKVRQHELIGVRDASGALIGVRVPGSLGYYWRSPNTPATVSTTVARIDGDHPSGGHFITMHSTLVKAKGADYDFDPELSLRQITAGWEIVDGNDKLITGGNDANQMGGLDSSIAVNKGFALMARMYDRLTAEDFKEEIDLKKAQKMFPAETQAVSTKATPEKYLYSWEHFIDDWLNQSAAKSAIGRIVSTVSSPTSMLFHAGALTFQFDETSPYALNPGIGKTVRINVHPSEASLPARVALAKYFINFGTDGGKAPEYNTYLFLNPEVANFMAFMSLYGDFEPAAGETYENAALRYAVQELALFLNESGAGKALLKAAREINNIRTIDRGTKKQRLTNHLVENFNAEQNPIKATLIKNLVYAWLSAQEVFGVYRAANGHRRPVAVSPGTLLNAQENYAKLGMPVSANVKALGAESIIPELSAEDFPQLGPALSVTKLVAKHVFPESSTLLLSPAGRAILASARAKAVKAKEAWGPWRYNEIQQAIELALWDRALNIEIGAEIPWAELRHKVYTEFVKFRTENPGNRLLAVLRVSNLREAKKGHPTSDIAADGQLIAGTADVFQKAWDEMPITLQLLLAKYAARRWDLNLHSRGGSFAQVMSPKFHAQIYKTYKALSNAFVQLPTVETKEIDALVYKMLFTKGGVGNDWASVALQPAGLLAEPSVVAPTTAAETALQTKIEISQVKGYVGRTRTNAGLADVTLAVATDFTTGGERLTKSSAEAAGKPIVQVRHESPRFEDDVYNIVLTFNEAAAKLGRPLIVNGAGNGVYTLESKSQSEADAYAEKLLTAVYNSPDRKFEISLLRSGGQTGYDVALIKAATKLGIPTLIHAALARNGGILIRPADGEDVGLSEAEYRQAVGLPSHSLASAARGIIAAAAIATMPLAAQQQVTNVRQNAPPVVATSPAFTQNAAQWFNDWEAQLIDVETYQEVPYRVGDKGKFTIGYGHEILPGENLTHLTEPEARELLGRDMSKHEARAREYIPEFDTLPDAAKTALADLAFWGPLNNKDWPLFKAAIEARDWRKAADELLDSTGTFGYKTLKASSPNGSTVKRYERDAAGLRDAASFSLAAPNIKNFLAQLVLDARDRAAGMAGHFGGSPDEGAEIDALAAATVDQFALFYVDTENKVVRTEVDRASGLPDRLSRTHLGEFDELDMQREARGWYRQFREDNVFKGKLNADTNTIEITSIPPWMTHEDEVLSSEAFRALTLLQDYGVPDSALVRFTGPRTNDLVWPYAPQTLGEIVGPRKERALGSSDDTFSLAMTSATMALPDEWFTDPNIDRYGKVFPHTPSRELHQYLLGRAGFYNLPPKPLANATVGERTHYNTELAKVKSNYRKARQPYATWNAAFRNLELALAEQDRTLALDTAKSVQPYIKGVASYLALERIIYDAIPGAVPVVPDIFTDQEYDREVIAPERKSSPDIEHVARTPQREADLGFSMARMSDFFKERNVWIKYGGAPLAHRMLYDMMNDVEASRQDESKQQEKWGKILGSWSKKYIQPMKWSPDGKTPSFDTDRKSRIALTEADKDIIEQFKWAVTAVLQELRSETGAEARKNKQALLEKAGIVFGPARKAGDVKSVSAFMAEWLASPAYAKLTAQGGRKSEQLDPLELALEAREFFRTVRDNVNNKFAFMLDEQPYLREKLGYAPMIFGMGFMDQDGMNAMDDIEILIRDASKDVASTWFSGKDAAEIFVKKYKGRIPPPAAKQVELYEVLTNGKSPRDSWNRVDLNQALMNLLKRRQFGRAADFRKAEKKRYEVAAGAAGDEARRDFATIKQLRLTQPSFGHKEWTARTMPSEYRSYKEAYELSRPTQDKGQPVLPVLPGLYVPRTMDIFKLRHTYVNEVYAAALNKVALNSMVNAVDIDGQPAVIAMPNLAYEGHEQVLTEGTWAASAEQLAYYINYLNRADKSFKPLVVDFSGDVKTQIQAMVNNYLPKTDYKLQESPYSSIVEFRALKGPSDKLLKQLIQMPKRWLLGDWDALAALMRAVSWTKHLSVGWSVFFATAIGESVIAGTGLARSNALFHPLKTYAAIRRVHEDLHNADPETMAYLGRATRQGLRLGDVAASDEPIGIVAQDIERWKDRVRQAWGDKAAAYFGSTMRVASGRVLSDKMFAGFTSIKLWAAREQAIRVSEARGIDTQGNIANVPNDILREVANPMNNAYGGQNWLRYIWATPQVRQVLNLLMFAPNWTLSAWNIAGGGLLTGKLLGNYMDKTDFDFVFKTNWPAMFFIVLIAIPNATQAAIWAFGQATGTGDDDDNPFTFMNEEGRKSYVDTTPLMRLSPSYTGAPSGQRRTYARWGKQALEVVGSGGWLQTPVDQFLRKLSQPAKLILEELTGRSPGSDWNLEFAGQGFAGWFATDDDGVQALINSRIGYAVQKFIPMSVLQVMKDPQTLPLNFAVPVSKGASTYTLVNKMVEVLNTYANQHQWSKIRMVPKFKANLEGLGRGLLDAAASNGIDPEKILSSAKGVVLGHLYRDFWDAMNKNDTAGMDAAAQKILRVGGTIRGLKTSVSNRSSQFGKDVTPEMASAIEEALK